jgi:CRP-like cAMP-binding protein
MTGITQAGSTAELIVEYGARRSVLAGSTVFREGDAGGFVYAVVSGEVKLTVATSAGRDVLVGVKRPGDAFGELAALDGRARSATATATRPTVLAAVDAAMFVELLETRPAAAIETLRLLAAYLRAANQRVSAHAGDDTVARCARQLLDLADRHAEHRAGGRRAAPAGVTLAISQDDLAAWIGTTRESAARALAKFRAAGCITTTRGRITITDAVALQQFAP